MILVKNFLIVIFSFFLASISSKAADIKATALNEISEQITEYTLGVIPGEGHTEFSFDLRENSSPNFSILGVREIFPGNYDSGKIFTQFSLANNEDLGEERYIFNLGFGQRTLIEDNTVMIGFNNFYDYDLGNGNTRASLGGELRSASFEVLYNRYLKINSQINETVLEGWDWQLASQFPYLHWMDIFVNTYNWIGVERDDVAGSKFGTELQLTPTFNLELAYDDKDKAGVADEWYAKLRMVYPPKDDKPTLLDGKSDEIWRENKDMSGELLSKVKRQNKIMIEFKGNSTISRTD